MTRTILLGSGAREARVALGPGLAGRPLQLTIRQLRNPANTAFLLSVSEEKEGRRPLTRYAPYPSDSDGRIAVGPIEGGALVLDIAPIRSGERLGEIEIEVEIAPVEGEP